MKNIRDDLGEVFLYFINHETIEQVKGFYPKSVAEEIEEGRAFGMVISEENEIKGGIGASFDGEENRLELHSLYIMEEARRRALASTLLLQLMEAVMEETEGELKAVTCSFPENTEGIRELLEKIGFIIEAEEGAESFFIEREQLENSILVKDEEENHQVLSYLELSEYERKELYRQLAEEGASYISLKDLGEIRGELSFVIFDEKHHLKACSLLSGKEKLVFRQFYAAKGNTGYAMKVLRASVNALRRDKDWNKAEVHCLTPSSSRLLQKLTGVGEKKKYLHGILKL